MRGEGGLLADIETMIKGGHYEGESKSKGNF
jgi:hypothetical protein